MAKCSECRGTEWVECHHCEGQGHWNITCRNCGGRPAQIGDCDPCDNSGSEEINCRHCDGTGELKCPECC